MTTIAQRIRNIVRSNFDTKLVDNYATTKERLNSAFNSIESSLNKSKDLRAIAVADSYNYGIIHAAYEKRVQLLSELVDNPDTPDHSKIVSIYELAVKMSRVAERSQSAAKSRLTQIDAKRRQLEKAKEEILSANAQLEVAQQMVKGRERLEAMASRGVDTSSSVLTGYDDELKNASRIAKEAEALAEIKGWGIA